MGRLFAALILVMSTTAWAGEYEDGMTGHAAKDYAKAMSWYK